MSNVVQIVSHEKYKQYNLAVRNDIALLRVEPAFKLGSRVGVACLPSHDEPLPYDAECYLTGKFSTL